MLNVLLEKRIVRYLISGSVSTGVYYGTLVTLVEVISCGYLSSAAVGLVLQWQVNYHLHRLWTFRGGPAQLRQALLHLVSFVCMFALELAALWLLVEYVGMHYLVAAITVGLSLLYPNFKLGAFIFNR